MRESLVHGFPRLLTCHDGPVFPRGPPATEGRWDAGLAIAIVAFVWSLQHAFMPLTFDARFMAFRLLSPVPHSAFATFFYLRFRRLVPWAIDHALMDGASVLIGVLLPLLRA